MNEGEAAEDNDDAIVLYVHLSEIFLYLVVQSSLLFHHILNSNFLRIKLKTKTRKIESKKFIR